MLTHVNGKKVLNMKHLARLLGMAIPNPPPSSLSSSPSSSSSTTATARSSFSLVPDQERNKEEGEEAKDGGHAGSERRGGADLSVEDSLEKEERNEAEDFVIFLLENKVQLVLEKSKAEAMQPNILKQHAIHSPTSEVL